MNCNYCKYQKIKFYQIPCSICLKSGCKSKWKPNEDLAELIIEAEALGYRKGWEARQAKFRHINDYKREEAQK